MKKVYFDVRHLSKGGIGVFINEVLKRLVKSNNSICLITNNVNEISEYLKFSNVSYLIASRLFSLFEQYWFLSKKTELYNQIYISPYLTFPIFFKVKLIYIVHDLIWLHRPEYATGKLGYLYFKYFLKQGIKRSVSTLTISINTKNDIQKFVENSSNKVAVYYNGLNADEFDDVIPSDKPYKYFIYVGNWKPWKKIPVLLNAFSSFCEKVSNQEDVKLVLCGDNRTNMSDDIEEILSTNTRLSEKVIITGKVERKELLKLVKGAIALVQPSEYEGFGMAVAEGLALGVPVICSNIPVFQEIFGENVYYYQACDQNDLAVKLFELFKMKKDNFITKTIDQRILFEKFDWQKIVSKIIDLIERS